MEELTKAEEKIMQALWDIEKGFVKDIIAHLEDEPKPQYTTVSTIVRILENKGFVSHIAYGKTHEYFPLVTRAEYRRSNFKRLVTDYFDGSLSNVLSFMVSEEKLDAKEMAALKKFINKQ
jgi:BlaI family transcriptional regulator, penicillinase repressor